MVQTSTLVTNILETFVFEINPLLRMFFERDYPTPTQGLGNIHHNSPPSTTTLFIERSTSPTTSQMFSAISLFEKLEYHGLESIKEPN